MDAEHVEADDTNDDDKKCIPFDVGVLDLLDFGGPNVLRNGDQVYKASHLLELGVVSYGVTTCKIEGICIQSSHPADKPHTLTIDTAENFKNWKFHCTCKAGNGGRCKHLCAALLHINTEKKLEIITCTQRKKNWGKVPKGVVETILEPELICNLEEMKCYQRREYKSSEEERKRFAEILFSDPGSAIAVFMDRHNRAEASKAAALKSESQASNDVKEEAEPRGFLTRLFTNSNFNSRISIFSDIEQSHLSFYNKQICLNSNEAINLCSNTCDQTTDLWCRERKLRITASECYKLFTASKNPKTDWTSKIASYFTPKPNRKNFEIGRREEKNAVKLYERQTNTKVTKIGLVVHPTCPWLGCSPDGLILETKTVIEVKTLTNENNLPFELLLPSVAYLKFIEGSCKLREKTSHFAQVQLNMHLLCVQKAHLVIHNYKSLEILVINVDYDKDFCLALIDSLKSVYFRYALPYIFENFITQFDKENYK